MKVSAGLLGATGAVGQRYVKMLQDHPFISLDVLMGGESAGKKYGEAVHWLFSEDVPDRHAAMVVRRAAPESARGCHVIFSALPSEVAGEIEQKFASSGFTVVSEASSHRMDADVPLMIPEVNPGHLGLLEVQRRKRGWKGSIAATPNCTVTGLALVLKPLLDRFPAQKAVVTTMQALSGAGYPGVPSLAITENVIPYIKNEEEKVAREAKKILGSVKDGTVEENPIAMAISCNRVQVIDGHTETLYAEFDKKVDLREAARVLSGFRGRPQRLGLPTAPKQPIIVRSENDRPQPRIDRMAGTVPGMSVTVGRLRRGVDDRSLLLTLLSHNTIRGAAGTAILTAELMQREGYIG
jgi:aspartate-semialdehyde dehydrogenase